MLNDEWQVPNQKSEIRNQKSQPSRLASHPSRLCLSALPLLAGRIAIDGKPAANAAISFRPLGHDANTAGITVFEGAFRLPQDKGLLPGRYAVAVQAYRDTGRTFDDPQRGKKMPEYEPLVFKSIAPSEIEVSADKPNEFEIQVSTGG